MLRIIYLIAMASIGSMTMAQTTGETPEITVKDYIVAFEAWNNEAVTARQNGDDNYNAGETFAVMLEPFLLVGIRIGGISYGRISQHQAGRDRIELVDINGDTAQVFTQSSDRYRFDLTKRDDRWWLTQVYFIGNDGTAMPILAPTQ